MKRQLQILLAIGAVSLIPELAFAANAALSGSVTEGSNGKPIAGAEIRVIGSTGKNRGGSPLAELRYVQDSGTDGTYAIADVEPGTYTVVVTHPEFKPSVNKDVQVTASGATLNAQLANKTQY